MPASGSEAAPSNDVNERGESLRGRPGYPLAGRAVQPEGATGYRLRSTNNCGGETESCHKAVIE